MFSLFPFPLSEWNPSERDAFFRDQVDLRISPEPHEKIAIPAQATDESINTVAQKALQESFV